MVTKLDGRGKVRKGLDASPRVKLYDEAFMDDGRFVVTLADGFAFDDAAEHVGDDPEGKLACHVRSFGTQAEALDAIKAAKPCRCGRCLPNEQQYIEHLDGYEFSPRLDDACQYSTMFRDGKAIATLQRRRVMEQGPGWKLYDTNGRLIRSLWGPSQRYRLAAERAIHAVSVMLGE